MSLLAYKDKNDPDYQRAKDALQRMGWVISDKQIKNLVKQNVLGYKAQLFERRDENGDVIEACFMFAGTDDGSDFLNDLAIFFLNGLSSQPFKAIHDAKKLNETYIGIELTFGGHSLGGALAKYAAKSTGRAAITFNAAPTPFMEKLFTGTLFKSSRKIENYNNIFDPLEVGRILNVANVIFNGITETFSKGFHGIKGIIRNVYDNWGNGSSSKETDSKTLPKGGKQKNDTGDSRNYGNNE